MKHLCNYCQKPFTSKHSVAKFCSRKCYGKHHSSNASEKAQKYTDEDLLQYLRDTATKLGRTPNKRDMLKPNEWTIRKRFGSWNTAIIKAGLEPNVSLPPRMLELDKGIRLSTRFTVLKRDNYTCQYCGGTPELGYTLHIDHIIPQSKQGTDKIENLTTACWQCNIGKSNN